MQGTDHQLRVRPARLQTKVINPKDMDANRVICEVAQNMSERMQSNLPVGYVKNM